MYRSLTGVYFSLASQTLRARMHRANVFVLTLGPHGASTDEVLSFIVDLSKLDRGMVLTINGEEKAVLAFPIFFAGDMPQQNHNSGVKNQNAGKGCRNCLANTEERGDLNFDTIKLGCYHWHQMQLWQYGNTLPPVQRRTWLQKWGLTSDDPVLFKLSPALNIITTRPADVAHSEYNGQGKQAQELLMKAILSASGLQRYAKEFARFPSPARWDRRQSPIHHSKSWSLSEAGMVAMQVPLILRCKPLREDDVEDNFLDAVHEEFRYDCQELKLKLEDIIVCAFAAMAVSNAATCSPITQTDRIQDIDDAVYEGRRSFIRLCSCAHLAARVKDCRGKGSGGRRNEGQSSLAPSTASSEFDAVVEELASSLSTIGQEFENRERFRDLKPTSKRAEEFVKWQHRPNVHQGAHLSDITRRFGNSYTCNVLHYEDKHRLFKKWAEYLNGRGVEKALVHRENVNVTLRLILQGAFDQSHPVISAQVKALYHQCPMLAEHILPSSQWADTTEDDALDIKPDATHIHPRATHCVARAFVKNELDLPLQMRDVPEGHLFSQPVLLVVQTVQFSSNLRLN
ncbi:hypothetical protein GMDG_06740 [Pseudogymnoascus destructans 20631-21]|uniref:Uncharacterized protein n=2 Tax=Pseudogymnoascus destructans TaxID=655981 RepID=L8FXB8_PSED2|nr:hypothetical protein GMDG_06740 [Pseudogymnoascus destructans 20631-21]